ncbi:protein translocase subunit SecD [candidate division KSB1 bacterium]|nr:protein translocase subunit SecD [candidate division KSB1 bacterium]RQW03247.1 MAG: protein translocase subunit SecD [candidate division KSB1 bacterium]
MQRSHITKLILVLALLIIAGVSLYPTFRLSGLHQRENKLFADIESLTGLTKLDIDESLTVGDLEARIRKNASGDSMDKALQSAAEIIELSAKIEDVEKRAIKQGLDLQGGTYLVYEADLPQLLRNLAKNQDDQLEDIIAATKIVVEQEGAGFFTALEQNFKSRNIDMNRYFGRKGQTNQDIIRELRDEAEDAINRTLEVLRNRIDQFGVSEPSITKQGTNRIVIELAGVTSIQRAKNVISSTAQLEFKLVEESELTWSILDDIDRVMRVKQRGEALGDTLLPAEPDSAQLTEGEQAEEEEVSIEDLFGEQTEEIAEEDTTLLVDQNTFSDKPFTALLRQISGSNYIAVPAQNVRAVQRIINLPEVQAVIPSDVEILFGNEPMIYGEDQYERMYITKKEPELLGEMLSDASVQISGGGQSLRAGAPYVSMELNNEGAKTFSKVTGMNIGRYLAIVLDGKVASAPVIETKISTGSAMIEGTFSMEEAQDLALILRAGALPAPLYSITENTVGPSLGQDSINRGRNSVLIGLLLVILFMIIYYKAAGVVADFALMLNIVFVFAVMAGFHATLTLPGIAGIILTVGMAVDANVLIFERIREELKSGKTVRAAIDAGYGRAFSTILDANVTTLITAIVLYSFGTGPIKGFALTLSIGILASMFTAIVVTRLIFDIITSQYAIKKLSI